VLQRRRRGRLDEVIVSPQDHPPVRHLAQCAEGVSA
jgi:hypothetical protein